MQKIAVPEMVHRWDEIAIQLGFDPVEIQRIKQNHQPHPVENACKKMLWEWRSICSNTLKSDLAKDLIQAVNDAEYAFYAEQFNTGLK